jgi:enoyl-[acyl-carrier protein] reductase II
MEASIALSRQVAGRIDEVKPVARIIEETMAGFFSVVGELADRYVGAAVAR